MCEVNIWTNEYNPFNKWKVVAWYTRMLKIKTGNFDPPVNIALDIVQGTQDKKLCGGFNCNFCMSNLEEKGKESKVPQDILFAIPEFYHKWGVESICLAGHHSDPLMYNHSDLMEFLRLCNTWHIEVGFVSNGAHYTDYVMEEIARTCNWSGWSINAGTSEDHEKITGSKKGTFQRIIENMKFMSDYAKTRGLDHDIGYKYLITDDNYKNILTAIKIARDAGARHFQIRPSELPVERSKKIDTQLVEDQIREGLKLEKKDEFEVFGIREKFNPDFTKKRPIRCIASPLGSTWMADGDVVICPDRRWSAHLPNMVLGNFITEGLESIRRKWGSVEHGRMIEEANKQIDNCIRCTAWHWHDLYENVVSKDKLDITLI